MGFFHKPFQMGPLTPARMAQLPRATLCQTLTAWKFALQNILYILCLINSLQEIEYTASYVEAFCTFINQYPLNLSISIC